MESLKLKVRLREDLSKSRLKEMRRNGLVPGNFYGKGKPTLSLEVELAPLARALRSEAGMHAMFDVAIEGSEHGEAGTAVVKKLQRDPITRRVLHVDFARVSASDKITSTVTIAVVGDAPGTVLGGTLETVMDSVSIKCRADRVPGHLDVDVSGLELGQFVYASDIKLPEDCEMITKPDDIVVAMRMPHVRAAEAAPAEAAG